MQSLEIAPGAAIAVLLVSVAGSAVAWAGEGAWVVVPNAEEADLPPVGRSLFDVLVAGPFGGTVPFPFGDFLAALQSMLVDDDRSPALRRVLIPAGRSLQRNGSGEHFRFPRAVAAVTGDSRADGPAAQMLLRDRLFVAYLEPAGVLEVISYNEDAGRFEFQIVKDYRRDTVAKVFYAPRSICRSCHQNAAPIFSRGEWRETNAHRAVSARIGPEGSMLYGVPVHVSVAEPAGIDESTDRANALALAQFVWTEGCGSGSDGVECRAELLGLALRLRLTGMDPTEFTRSDAPLKVEGILGRNWSARWVDGVAMPNGDLPNRTPTLLPVSRGGLANHVERSFDPLEPRAPLRVWRVFDRTLLSRSLRVMAAFFDTTDASRLDEMAQGGLFGPTRGGAVRWPACRRRIRAQGARQRWVVRCEDVGVHPGIDGIDLRLEFTEGSPSGGRAAIEFPSGRLTEFALGVVEESESRDWRHLLLRPSGPVDRPRPRTPDGARIDTVRVTWKAPPSGPGGQVELSLGLKWELDGFDAAIRRLGESGDALSSKPFRRAAIRSGLGLGSVGPAETDIGEPRMGSGPLRPEELDGGGADRPALGALYRFCGACHLSREASPPNFLTGGIEAVRAQIARCAPRIRYRLAMWQRSTQRRGKSPMPPALRLSAGGRTGEWWVGSDALRRIGDYLDRVAPDGHSELLNDGTDYEELPPCEGASKKSAASGIRPSPGPVSDRRAKP